MDYQPQPIDTGAIALTDAQQRLVETLASNAHDVWAVTRLAQGWRFGPERNDTNKTHPSLIAYAALPESEKDVDRAMVEQVIKAALALGYKIDAPDG
jgi:ryanodine receptor 2